MTGENKYKNLVKAASGQANIRSAPLKYISPDCVDMQRVKALVIGRAGVGKTSLLRTIPENERVCTLSAEGGLLSVSDLVMSGWVKGVIIEDYANISVVLKHLETDWQEKFDWVFVDSLSEVAAMCYQKYHSTAETNDFGKHWHDYYFDLSRLIKRFMGLPKYHVIFTCLETTVELNGRNIQAPNVPSNSMRTQIPGMFDEVFYMDVDQGVMPPKRIFRTDISVTESKSRSGVLDKTEPANLGIIRDKILNTLDRRPKWLS
jgi:hypothetical protein